LLNRPVSIALPEDGKAVFVVDADANKIVAFDREGEETAWFPLPRELTQPASIVVAHNQVQVLGSFLHIAGEFSPSGTYRGHVDWDGVRRPGAFTYDPVKKRYFVTDLSLMIVKVFGEDGNLIAAFGQRGEQVDQMERVDSIYVDREGAVYLTDSLHGKVLVFAERTGAERVP
ncbi:MAG: hypothetical protein KGN84_11750, partial [Acidobacteriota bacterium]|nr:hypothetical protein [Acidobacteriota bacterium]